jgi:hypothetical protein
MLKYRVTPHTDTGLSSCELCLKTAKNSIKPDVGKRIENSQQKMKNFHDREIAKVRVFGEGD